MELCKALVGRLMPIKVNRLCSYKFRKLSPRGDKCVFIRYFKHSKGYVLCNEHPDSGLIEIESQDVNFLG